METSYNELISLIDNKRNEELLSIKEESNNKRVEYLSNFFDQYSIKRPITWVNLKPSEILFTFLLAENPDIDFDILKEEVDEIKDRVNLLDAPVLEEIGIIAQGVTDEQIDKVIELEKEIKGTKNQISNISKKKKIKVLLESSDNIEQVQTLLDGNTLLEVIELIKVFKKIHNDEYLSFVCLISAFQKKFEAIRRQTNSFIPEDELENSFQLSLGYIINSKSTEKILTPTFNYYATLERRQNSILREKNKKIYQYTELLEILKKENKKEEITNIDQILDKAPEEEIRLTCLKYIYDHNQNYYQNLEKQYNYKKENSIISYINYFESIGINFNELSAEIKQEIMKTSIEETKEKCKLLLKAGLNSKELIIICSKSNIKTIEKIDKLLQQGYLNTQLLKQELSIYFNDDLLKQVINNINLILSLKINLLNKVDKSFLLIDNSLLRKNIRILDKSKMLPKKAQIISLEMLTKTNLQEEINSLVEIGLEETIKENPEILNYDSNLVKRIIITKMVGEEVLEDKKIKSSILEKETFFVPNQIIDDYLFDRDNSNYHCKNEIELDGNIIETELSYTIEGIHIPKARVKNLNVSLETIIRPSLYSKEEIKVLEKYKKEKKLN